ncbi:MAG: hypothetical protein K1060chlam2_00163 [Chlamydiae bacterium]|nr:hypothetical protein [Chlamydiota bacterium]
MKKFILIPLLMASFTFATATEVSKSQTLQVQTEQKLIDEVLSDYRDGSYNSFLKGMDSTYKKENKKWEYNSALEERKKLSTYVQDYSQVKPDHFKIKVQALAEKQDRELIDVTIAHPNEKFCREVRDMVFFTPSPEQQQSLDYLHELSYKFKGDGVTPLENKLINIDTEFWLKGLSLGVAKAQNRVDLESYQKRHIVLQIEKLKQMKEACDSDEYADIKTQNHIRCAIDIIPKVYASSATRKHLMALGQGKITANSEAEREMQQIMANYFEKEQKLINEHFPEGSAK